MGVCVCVYVCLCEEMGQMRATGSQFESSSRYTVVMYLHVITSSEMHSDPSTVMHIYVIHIYVY